jgi:hypothetical protein
LLLRLSLMPTTPSFVPLVALGESYIDFWCAQKGLSKIDVPRSHFAARWAACDAVDGSSTGTRVPSMWVLLGHSMIRRSQAMQTITTVGLDIAKSVFQVHCADADGKMVLRRQLKRRYVLAFFQKLPPCLVGIEACASSHHWSRERSHRHEPAHFYVHLRFAVAGRVVALFPWLVDVHEI